MTTIKDLKNPMYMNLRLVGTKQEVMRRIALVIHLSEQGRI